MLLFGVCNSWKAKYMFKVPKCAICGLKFWESKIIWGLIFLVSRCPRNFLYIKLFLETGQLIIGVFKKVGLIIWGSKKIA